ncbi:Clavaminate synthase-like protein [Xylariaceae sp. FL0594]|nr:Clavaminate synthase-like protein [Xylariaceae sp. FL0594]
MMTAHVLPAVTDSVVSSQGWTDQAAPELPVPSSRRLDSAAQPPLGFPSTAEGPTLWAGNGGVTFDAETLELSSDDVTEVEQALKHFLCLELDGSEVSRETFPLPQLGPRLDGAAANLHRGSGIHIVRGLTPSAYTAEVNAIIFMGLASYIGDERGVQTSKGAMLTHVYESSSWTVPREKRHGIHTNNSLPFHNDMGSDILAIHVRSCAARGGGTFVSSAAAIYNAMMKTNPWAVHTLAKHNWPIQVSRRGASSFVLAPLLGFESGNLVVSMDPARIGPHPAVKDGCIPDLLPAQKEALAVLQQTAAEQQVLLPTRQGDLVFINNWAVLHAREAYHDDATATRHLVRLWLRNKALAWEIPASMKTPWESSFGARAKRLRNKQYPIAPMPEYMEPKFSNGSAAFVLEDSDEELEEEEL